MSLSKKIAAMAAPIAVFAFLLAVPASAQAPASPKADSPKADSPKADSPKADTYPKADANLSTPASESTHKKVEAHRRHWSKKHTPGAASGTNVSHKPTVAHKVM
jgi:hypothetical protein